MQYSILVLSLLILSVIGFQSSYAVPPLERVNVVDPQIKFLDRQGMQLDEITTGQQIIVKLPSFTSQPVPVPGASFGCVEKIVEGTEVRCIGYSENYKYVKGDEILSPDATNVEEQATSIISILDEQNRVVSLSWVSDVILKPYHVIEPEISWLPQDAGEYNVTVFFWESIDNPAALAPPITVNVTVSDT